jgi:RNA polymerase sigma factor (sigma-70 family)
VTDDTRAVLASLDDPDQFSVIFERHHRVVWTYIARVAGRDVADDLAGEVFTTAFRFRERFDPERGEVSSWLYGIATNLVRMQLRSDGRARRAFVRAAADQGSAADPTGLVDDAAELAALARRIRGAMSRLERADRELFILFAWEQLSYAEISDGLQIPVGTVRSRLSRARARLRALMDMPDRAPDDIDEPAEQAEQAEQERPT